MPSPAPPASSRRSLILVVGAVVVLGLVAAMAFVAGSATRSVDRSAADPSIVAASPAAGGSGQHGEGQQGGGHHGEGAGGLELYAVQSGLGTVVTDGEGRVLHGSDQDGTDPPAARCTAACAQEWLPLVVPPGQEPDLLGVDAKVVGRVARDDGSSQLTLGGWPVYVNRSDDGTLQSAAKSGAGWFAISPQGKKIEV